MEWTTLRVGMHAAQEIVDPEIGHENREESEGHIDMVGVRPRQQGQTLFVHGGTVDHVAIVRIRSIYRRISVLFIIVSLYIISCVDGE